MDIVIAVEAGHGGHRLSPTGPQWCEPVFALDPSGLAPLLSAGVPLRRHARHLAFQVTRRPGDLRAHARRILLHHAMRDADALYGALLDLFLALGPAGRELRRRLLASVGATLGETRHRWLEARLEAGIGAEEPEAAGRARLARPRRGSLPLVREAGAGTR